MDSGLIGWVVAAGTAAGSLVLLRAQAKSAAEERRQAQAELAALRERAERLAPDAGRAMELANRVEQLQGQGDQLHGQLDRPRREHRHAGQYRPGRLAIRTNRQDRTRVREPRVQPERHTNGDLVKPRLGL